MLALFQRLFNCDEKASRTELYLYIIFSSLFFIISYILYEIFYEDNMYYISVSGLIGIICAIFRRGKDRDMNNEKIINFLIKISLLLISCGLFYILTEFLSKIFDCETELSDNFYSIVFLILSGIYSLFFFFPILFLKGKAQDTEKKTATLRYIKPSLPKIGEIFNRDFIIGIFNFKGVTKREGFWIYSPIIIFNIWLTYYIIIHLFFNFQLYFYDPYGDLVAGPYFFSWEPYVLIGLAVITLALSCRRLRDLNIKPWKVIFLLIPPVNIFLIVLMLFGKTEE